MKKLINRPSDLVREMLEGFAATTPGIELARDANVILRSGLPAATDRKVAVISGGGSGHEPAHAGYVGMGMLTAAVAGDVFTSPDVDSILGAILATAGPAGALLIVKNYTGDRLNFGLAASLARSHGIPTEIVIVSDDVSLEGIVADDRRRGIAGTVFVHKVAGAAAERGDDLAAVASIARDVVAGVRSMGVALGSCIVPATGRASFELGADEVEFGLGIHGEKGVRRAAMASADSIVETLVEAIAKDAAEGGSHALLVNGLGGTPAMELQLAAGLALSLLDKRGMAVDRVLAGNFMTAIEMPGLSLSLLRLNPSWLELLDAPVSAPAWPYGGAYRNRSFDGPAVLLPTAPDVGDVAPDPRLKTIVKAVAERMIEAEDELCKLDSLAGDGDLGTNLSKGARALLSMKEGSYACPRTLLFAAADTLRRSIGGSSGPFYAVGILRAAQALEQRGDTSASAWADAFDAAVAGVSELGGARVGDRTMLDALQPAAYAFRRALSDGKCAGAALRRAAAAAVEGAQKTVGMVPKQGRASYLGQKPLGTVDGGAVAVAWWLESLARNIDDR
jgi:dihydroxyacetone kinase